MNEAYRETQKKSEANAASSSGVACMPGTAANGSPALTGEGLFVDFWDWITF